jgi:hypothetical protein
VVAVPAVVATLREWLQDGTLAEFAERHPERRVLAGRGAAYAVPLDASGTSVVVRHNRHGGLLAPVTGDLFLPPTRAPHELDVALRLRAAGVPTPEVLAYAIYPAGPLLRRSDVLTREIPTSEDLAAILADASVSQRRDALDAAARLIAALCRVGAHHHDLNLKNVLLARESEGTRALVLDVDRVTFGRPGARKVVEGNLARFVRSARKWRALYGVPVGEPDLARVAASVRSSLAADAPNPRTRA